jgi:cytochrome b561
VAVTDKSLRCGNPWETARARDCLREAGTAAAFALNSDISHIAGMKMMQSKNGHDEGRTGDADGGALRPPMPRRYSTRARTLHWLIAALLAIQFVTAVLLPHIGRDAKLTTTINAHFSIGIIILVVAAVRFLQRLLNPVALEAALSPRWGRFLARTTHLTFYVILLVGPFLGWASASAHNVPVSLFGVIPLPALAAPKARWALTAGDIHTYAMWTLLGLIALHVAAALFHYWVRRDGVLQSMLPGLAARTR